MTKNPKKVSQVTKVRLTTTLGDLLAAAYDVAGCRVDQAADLVVQMEGEGTVVGRRLRFV